MSYNYREESVHEGQPFELYLFETETESYRMTSADRAIDYLGETYEPAAIERTATSQGQELESGSITISIPLDHPIASEFIGFIPSTPMSIVIYRGHDSEREIVTHFTGGISLAAFTDVCELTAIPESEILKRNIPIPRYQSQCNHIVYDSGCLIDKATFLTAATLISIADDTIHADEFASQVDGWFTSGYIEKGTQRRMIINHVGNTVVLLTPMAGLTPGDTINAFAGCQRDSATCIAKFDNIVHFLGFERIPTRNPFASGIQ